MDLARINNFSIFPQQRTLATQPILYRKEQRTDPCIKSLVTGAGQLNFIALIPLKIGETLNRSVKITLNRLHTVYEFVKT